MNLFIQFLLIKSPLNYQLKKSKVQADWDRVVCFLKIQKKLEINQESKFKAKLKKYYKNGSMNTMMIHIPVMNKKLNLLNKLD